MQNIAPIYLLSSDEPLLIRDWLDEMRASMKQQGFEDIQSLSSDTGFDWNELVSELDMPSLFADKKCRIVRIPGGKPGQQGARIIQEICEKRAEDTVFIFVLPGLSKALKSAAWYKRAQQVAEVKEIASVKLQQLPEWVRHRASLKSLSIDAQSAAFLAERTEGNLLAADQELEKLSIRFDGQEQAKLSFEVVEQSVAQSSRYNHFILMDACLSGNLKRAIRVLSSLAAEGYVTTSLLWALQSALENLACLKRAQMTNQLNSRLWQQLRIWNTKQDLYQRALARLNQDQIECLLRSCATLDRIGKGQQEAAFADADWLQMKKLVGEFCGIPSIEKIEAIQV